ncbi:MAG TPA: transcriptional regulator [Candidatus Acetothermia bacterium]|nr:transcriptional regulator [Candidatus Acetothermia bacterium]HEX32756.1 transcriptional regulator [Candidatus Acetothermia bacterium]
MPEEKQSGEERLVKAINKGMGNRIHIRLSRFHDRDYLDIRNFYEADDGEWKPTRKGIAVPVELYGELMDALKGAEQMIKDLPPVKKEEGKE